MATANLTRLVYGYGRASDKKQDITPEVQREVSENWFSGKQAVGKLPDHQWGGWFFDKATSSKIYWFERPHGKELLMRLRPGDTIICSKYDRVFRHVVDCSNSLDLLNTRGVGLVLLDCDFDTSTILGRACMKMIGVMKEVEREETCERTTAALQWKIRQGLPVGGQPPIGWKKRGKKKTSRFVPNPGERRWCFEIIRLHDEEGLTFDEIYWKLRKHGPKHGNGREWIRDRIVRAYHAAKDDFPIYGRHHD